MVCRVLIVGWRRSQDRPVVVYEFVLILTSATSCGTMSWRSTKVTVASRRPCISPSAQIFCDRRDGSGEPKAAEDGTGQFFLPGVKKFAADGDMLGLLEATVTLVERPTCAKEVAEVRLKQFVYYRLPSCERRHPNISTRQDHSFILHYRGCLVDRAWDRSSSRARSCGS